MDRFGGGWCIISYLSQGAKCGNSLHQRGASCQNGPTMTFMEAISLQAVGWVQGSRKQAIDDNWDAESASIHLDKDCFGADALSGLSEFSHVEVLFFMDKVSTSERQFGARHPRGDQSFPLIGVFSQRGKNRPNPIGLTVCKVKSVRGTILEVEGLDAVDGTPILDIKPWMSAFGPRGKVIEPAWVSRLMGEYWLKDSVGSDDRIGAAINQRRANNLAGALEILNSALRDTPTDPMVHYQIGWSHDALGKEADAVEPYKQALAFGLKGAARLGVYVGLSSTLRCLGRYIEALEVIDKGRQEYPSEMALSVFRSLILNNLNRGDEAITDLLTILLDTTADLGVRQYDRALRFYSSRLREKFE